jgi:hypothetical protein
MQVLIPDPDLYRRLRDQVAEGQDLRVTTETDCDALHEGDTLLAFAPAAVGSPAPSPASR